VKLSARITTGQHHRFSKHFFVRASQALGFASGVRPLRLEEVLSSATKHMAALRPALNWKPNERLIRRCCWPCSLTKNWRFLAVLTHAIIAWTCPLFFESASC
jgi:hypothetical protein